MSLPTRAHTLQASSSNPFTVNLHLLSRDAGKPQLAEAARRLAASKPDKDAKLDVQAIDSLIFGVLSLHAAMFDTFAETSIDMTGLPEVDLIIVHPLSGSSNWPIELHGFPPWQMRLAEI
jgi:dehydrodolichyl diphosphate syntase complex subunit NUS1